MQVHQLVYTKVPPGTSPWGKTGFHTVFYPLQLLEKKQLLEIESHLHFPGLGVFNQKHVVFFRTIQSQPWLVILHLRGLPEEKDEFGREGVFLAQAFFISPEHWPQLLRPNQLFDALDAHVFPGIQALLESPLINKETGEIQPITIDDALLKPSGQAPRLTDRDRKLLFPLYKLSTNPQPGDGLLVKGEPHAIEEALGNLYAFFPSTLRPNLGWDSGFDGGKLFFFPLKTVGYSQDMPTTGGPLHITLATGAYEQHERLAELLQPATYYERWLGTLSTAPALDKLDYHHRLAQFLEVNAPFEESLQLLDTNFAAANAGPLKNTFASRVQGTLPQAWINLLAEGQPAEVLLRLLVEGLRPEALTAALEQAILDRKISAADIEDQVPEALVRTGSARFRVLMSLWDDGSIGPSELDQLVGEERDTFLRYVIHTPWAEQKWFLKLLLQYPHDFNALLTERVFVQKARPWVEKQVGGAYKRLAGPIADQILHERAIEALATNTAGAGNEGFLGVLNRYLQRGTFSLKELAPFIELGTRGEIQLANHAVLQAFALPQGTMPLTIKDDKNLREKLLSALVYYHGYGRPQLEQLGYEAPDITRALQKNKPSLLTRILRKAGLKR